MKCKNCGKEIEENEIFCFDCKMQLKTTSSKKKLDELELLISEHNKNTLENTKDLTNLSNLVMQTPILNNEQEIKEEQIDSDDDFLDENKSSKKLLIIISSVILILILFLIIIFITINKNKKVEEKIIDYNAIMKNYGVLVSKAVDKYLETNDSIPTFSQLKPLIDYDEHNIQCEIKEIYDDKKVYLSLCKIDLSKETYEYGEKQTIIEEGLKLNIYKGVNDINQISYTSTAASNTTLLGTITCKGMNCLFKQAFDKYAVIEEDNEYYLYNYETDTMEFGPFTINHSFITNVNKLYGIYYTKDNINYIYNVKTSKTFKNIIGSLYSEGYKTSSIYEYGYVITRSEDLYNFYNLKTGNISYKISSTGITNFIEDSTNKVLYFYAFKNDTDFNIYNSNGKLLFNNFAATDFIFSNKQFIISNKNKFEVYDINYKLVKQSKEYNKIILINEKYILAIDNNFLNLIGLDDQIIVTFEKEWNSAYLIDDTLTGYRIVSNQEIFYAYIKNSSGDFEYYYIPSTGEQGINYK